MKIYRLHGRHAASGDQLRVGQGMQALWEQCATIGMQGLLSLTAWRQACRIDAEHAGSNAVLAYFIVSTYAFGDLMNHALLTRVGQTQFPRFYKNRGSWLFLVLSLTLLLDHQLPGLKWVAAVGSVAVHTQYSVRTANVIAQCLGINIFVIRTSQTLDALAHV